MRVVLAACKLAWSLIYFFICICTVTQHFFVSRQHSTALKRFHGAPPCFIHRLWKNVYFRWITSNFLKCKWHRTANTPFAVHCEKIRNHLRETATSSLARKYEHLRIYMYQIQLRFLHFNQHSIHARNSFPTDWGEPISLYTVCNHGFRVIGDGKNFTVSLLRTVQNVMCDISGSVTFENNCSLYTRD